MLKWMCVAAAAMALTAPAFAQKTDLPDRPAKQITPFDVSAMNEGQRTLKVNGACTARYVIAIAGKAKDITVDCTHPEMVPFVIKTIETGVWEPEIFDHEFFDSDPIRQAFNYGSGAAVDPRGQTAPTVEKDIEPRDVQAVITKVRAEGTCQVKFTVGADGKPKDIVPNCTPEAYNTGITEAVGKMTYKPGLKDGKPTDWPNMVKPIKLGAPEKKN
jgi:hypothetical protein